MNGFAAEPASAGPKSWGDQGDGAYRNPVLPSDYSDLDSVLATFTGPRAYFVKPAAGHAYCISWSLDGSAWHRYDGHDGVEIRSPHCNINFVRMRYLKLTVLKDDPAPWEFRVY